MPALPVHPPHTRQTPCQSKTCPFPTQLHNGKAAGNNNPCPDMPGRGRGRFSGRVTDLRRDQRPGRRGRRRRRPWPSSPGRHRRRVSTRCRCRGVLWRRGGGCNGFSKDAPCKGSDRPGGMDFGPSRMRGAACLLADLGVLLHERLVLHHFFHAATELRFIRHGI